MPETAPKSNTPRIIRLPVNPKAGKKRNDTSRQAQVEDGFADVDPATNFIIKPPYRPKVILQIFDQSNILRQCIESYVTNIARYGYRVVPMREGEEELMNEKEKDILNTFLQHANFDQSLETVSSLHLQCYELFGYSFVEVIRNATDKVSLIRSTAVHTMRMTPQDKDSAVPVTKSIPRGNSTVKIKEVKKFRKYVQEVNGKRIFFKEFGDKRQMNFKTGKYEPTILAERATEILHERQYSDEVYGSPRWINQLPNILGSREAEEMNLQYFEDNTVPPLLISISGGRLTTESFEHLERLLLEQKLGKDRQNKALLIEAVAEATGLEGEGGSVRIQVDKLADQRQSDGLFKEYDDANQAKVRSSFRLPPALVGLSQDVTFATANTSVFIAETQVFAPERRRHDEFWNMMLINHPQGLNLQTVKIESRGPAITDPDRIIKSLTALNVIGAVTPRNAIDVANETLQLSMPQYPEPPKKDMEYQEWMDTPMPLAVRQAGTQQTDKGKETQTESKGKKANPEVDEDEGTKPATERRPQDET